MKKTNKGFLLFLYMKTIDNYILEKLKINKDSFDSTLKNLKELTKLLHDTFKSDVGFMEVQSGAIFTLFCRTEADEKDLKKAFPDEIIDMAVRKEHEEKDEYCRYYFNLYSFIKKYNWNFDLIYKNIIKWVGAYYEEDIESLL